MLDPHFEQWINLSVRWLHVIAGIAWIGASFYFNWLNSAFAPLEKAEPGVTGEVWSVHGGGFYRTVKYGVAPERLPKTLHWFIWEAYTTWISGFVLLILVYYLQARSYLLSPEGPLNVPGSIAVGVSTIIGGWVIYHAMCRSPLGKNPTGFALVGLPILAVTAWGLNLLLAPRAAFIHFGAMLGTIMAANVLNVIIPSQRRMVAEMLQGKAPDGSVGKQAALRSLHNNYFTLPVVFTMISIHYPATYGHAWNWMILLGLAVIGAGIRHYINLRHRGQNNAWIMPAATAGMIALSLITRPAGRQGTAAGGSFEAVRVVIARRCASCHSSTPTNSGFATAPQGIVLDTPEQIKAQAERIRAVAVAAQTMPLGNVTGMTDEERALVGKWVATGAPLR